MKVTYFSHHSLLEHIVPVPSIDLQGQEARKGTPERWASLRWTTTLRQHSLNLTGMLHLLHLLQCFCLENHTQLSCMVKYWTVFITWGRVQWDRSGPRALLTEACEMYTSVNAFEVEQITIASGCLKTSLLWVFTEMERKMLSLFYKEQRRHSEHILSALSSCPCTHKRGTWRWPVPQVLLHMSLFLPLSSGWHHVQCFRLWAPREGYYLVTNPTLIKNPGQLFQ